MLLGSNIKFMRAGAPKIFQLEMLLQHSPQDHLAIIR